MARYSNGDQFEIARLKRKCQICGRYMPPVGRARRAIGLEGRNHDDWPKRQYHKKCWKKRKLQASKYGY